MDLMIVSDNNNHNIKFNCEILCKSCATWQKWARDGDNYL